MQIDFKEENFEEINRQLTTLNDEIEKLNNAIVKVNAISPINGIITSDLSEYLTGDNSIGNLKTRITNIMQLLGVSVGDMSELLYMLKSLESGGISVTTNEYVLPDGIRYQITNIGELNESTPVLVFNHGWGQRHFLNEYTGGDYKYFYDWVKNGAKGVFNAVIITYNRYDVRQADGKQNVAAAQNILEDVKNRQGISSLNYKFAGFSDGGEPAIKEAADACRANSDLQSPEIMLLDGNVNPSRGKIFTEEDLKILGERNAIIYVVERSNVRPDKSHHAKWASYGINVISVRDQFAQISGTTGNSHMNVVADFTELGLVDFLVGQGTITTDKFKNNYDYFLPTTIFDKYTGEEYAFDIRGKTSDDVKSMLGQYWELTENSVSLNNIISSSNFSDLDLVSLNNNLENNVELVVNDEPIPDNNVSLDYGTNISFDSSYQDLKNIQTKNNNILSQPLENNGAQSKLEVYSPMKGAGTTVSNDKIIKDEIVNEIESSDIKLPTPNYTLKNDSNVYKNDSISIDNNVSTDTSIPIKVPHINLEKFDVGNFDKNSFTNNQNHISIESNRNDKSDFPLVLQNPKEERVDLNSQVFNSEIEDDVSSSSSLNEFYNNEIDNSNVLDSDDLNVDTNFEETTPQVPDINTDVDEEFTTLPRIENYREEVEANRNDIDNYVIPGIIATGIGVGVAAVGFNTYDKKNRKKEDENKK